MVRTTLATAALAVLGASSLVGASSLGQRWLSSWATMPQLTEPANLPSPPFNQTGVVFPNSTIRQSFKISLPGAQFRLRFSNVFSDVDLNISAVTVALPGNHSAVGTPDIDTSTLHTVTFDGNKGFEVPNGALVVSDTINWPIAENSILTVSMYLAGGQPSPSNSITSHPGSRTTSYYDFGDLTRAKNISSPTAQNAAHWYFLSGLEVVSADPTSYAVAIVGDSITDGRGSTTNGNDRSVPAWLHSPTHVHNPLAGGPTSSTTASVPGLTTTSRTSTRQLAGTASSPTGWARTHSAASTATCSPRHASALSSSSRA
jgi:hypothetical protein